MMMKNSVLVVAADYEYLLKKKQYHDYYLRYYHEKEVANYLFGQIVGYESDFQQKKTSKDPHYLQYVDGSQYRLQQVEGV